MIGRLPASFPALTGLFLLLVVAPTAWSQSSTGAAVGDRLQVRARSILGGPAGGVLREVTATELALSLDETHGELRIPLAGITELQRYAGSKRQVLGGIVAGALSGGLIGAASGGSNLSGEQDRRELLGMVGGGVIGGVLGYLVQTTKWTSLSPQTVRPTLLPGMDVRISGGSGSGSERSEGVLVEATPDSVVFLPRGGVAVRLGRTSIQSLEWPLRQKRATFKGAAIGWGIGAVVGAAVGLATYQDGGFIDFGRGGTALIGAVAGGALGAAAGGTIGYLSHYTVWEAEPGPRSALTAAPSVTTRHVGLVVSVSF